MANPDQIQILITAQTQGAINDVKRFANQLENVSAKSVPRVNRAMGDFGRSAGMAGMQVQQFVGQIQAGTKPMVALSQQAADLGFVLGFPLAGAVAGIVASFAGPLIDAVMGGQDSFKKLADSILETEDSYRKLTQAERDFLALTVQQEITNQEKAIRNLQDSLDNLNKAYDRIEDIGDINMEGYAEATSGAAEESLMLAASIKKMERELAASRQELEYILDPTKQLNDENAKSNRIISELEMRYQDYYTAADIAAGKQKLLAEQAKEANKELKKQERQMGDSEKAYRRLADRGVGAVEDSLTGLINGTKSVKDAFRDMASSIINDLIRMQIQKSITGPLFNMLSGALTGHFSGANAANANQIAAETAMGRRATGGPVSAGSTYLVGERGPELFTAPAGGGMITSNSQMGGGGVTQNINITTGVQQTVRAEILNLMPQISEAAKVAVLESRQRGGSFSRGLAGI